MVKLIRLQRTDDMPCYVNADAICHFSAKQSYTLVSFAGEKGNGVAVKETPDRIKDLISKLPAG